MRKTIYVDLMQLTPIPHVTNMKQIVNGKLDTLNEDRSLWYRCVFTFLIFKTTNFFAVYLINNSHTVSSHFVNSHSVVNVDKV